MKLIPKYQYGRSLIKQDTLNPTSWGNRGKGNELLSAFENGTSYVLFTLPQKVGNLLEGRGWKTDEEVTRTKGYNPKTHTSNGYRISGGIAPLVGGKINSLTEKLIKAIPNYVNKTYKGNYTYNTIPLAKYLQNNGIDISKFDNYDLELLMKLNLRSFKSDPNLPSRWVSVNSGKFGDKDAYSFTLMLNNKLLGSFDVIGKKGNLHAGSIENFNDGLNHKVSEDLYNAAINYGKQDLYTGLISGERLLSPEKTYSVWKHYPTKLLVSNKGVHGSANTYLGSVYKLIAPSLRQVLPIKSVNIFHPDKVSSNGRFKFTDWKDSNPFKLLVPYVVGLYLYNNETNSK